jgi:predicted lipid-binding transport protein (Tim44 family)
VRYWRKRRKRVGRVETAAAEASEDDPAFAAETVRWQAKQLFLKAQSSWDDRDRDRLRKIVGPELMVEWERRLDDFDRKGWHNRVFVRGEPSIEYVGIVNRERDEEDRAVVRIVAKIDTYVIDGDNVMMYKTDEDDMSVTLREYWTLSKRDGHWTVASIEQDTEGAHHLDAKIMAAPWSDDARLNDEAVIELADGLPEGFKPADVADMDFDGDARAAALDLALADGRFAPQVLEAAARQAVEAWAEAVDGEDEPLEAVAGPDAVSGLLYDGDESRKTRLVVRGPRVKSIRIVGLDTQRDPATMTIEVRLGGRRYVEDRDTAAVLSGSKDSATTFTERWTLALDGVEQSPWRLV